MTSLDSAEARNEEVSRLFVLGDGMEVVSSEKECLESRCGSSTAEVSHMMHQVFNSSNNCTTPGAGLYKRYSCIRELGRDQQ